MTCGECVHQAEEAPPVAWDFRFATADLPGRDRFEAWRDASRRLVGVDVTSDDPRSFDGEFSGRSLGPVTFVRSVSRMSAYWRTDALADESDEISLSIFGGAQRIGQPRADAFGVRAGGAFILAHDRPFSLTQHEDVDTSFHFVMERAPLMDLLAHDAPVAPGPCADGAVLSLIRGYIPTLATAPEALAPEAQALVGRHILDLVAALLRPTAEARAAIEDRGLKAARIKAILDLVARNCARQDLSAAWIALKLGISARQVHRLLEETPKTLQEHVLEARLQRALELLSDPFAPASTIAEIAGRSGFASPSHFARSFRTRFGETPTGVRAEAVRNAARAMAAPARAAA